VFAYPRARTNVGEMCVSEQNNTDDFKMKPQILIIQKKRGGLGFRVLGFRVEIRKKKNGKKRKRERERNHKWKLSAAPRLCPPPLPPLPPSLVVVVVVVGNVVGKTRSLRLYAKRCSLLFLPPPLLSVFYTFWTMWWKLVHQQRRVILISSTRRRRRLSFTRERQSSIRKAAVVGVVPVAVVTSTMGRILS